MIPAPLVLLLAPLAGALAIALGARRSPLWTQRCVAAALAATLAALFALADPVFSGSVPVARWLWLPAQDVALHLRVDGLAWMFALLVVGIGALVLFYARYYLHGDPRLARLYTLLLAFMAAMLGLVLAGDLLWLALCWELTSLLSFLLVGFDGGREAARRGARIALAVTAAGGLALLAAVVLIAQVVGSYALEAVLAAGPQLHAHPWYPVIVVLVVLAALTKSAQFPFHFWLPGAMAAPTPVSAYLHSATLVKAGVFLLARLHPALAGSDLWFWLVAGAGALTLVGGALMALFQHDLKGLLAYSTISHLGLITLLFGMNDPLAVVAGLFHILNHAAFKASLFMAVGIIDHECGTRDLRRINGLARVMPWTAALATVSALAMAGVPLLNGFLSKEMFFAQTLTVEGRDGMQWLVPALAVVAGAASVAYSARFVHDTFWNGQPQGLPVQPHAPPWSIQLPAALLALSCLAVGVLPGLTVGPLLALGAEAALGGGVPAYSLALWHGFNLPLLMSLIAFALGLTLYARLARARRLHAIDTPVERGRVAFLGARRLLDQLALAKLARTGQLGLTAQLRLLLLAALALVALLGAPLTLPTTAAPAPLAAWAVWALAAAATLALLARYRERQRALVLLGVVGLAVSLLFAWASAPDLALTQLLVEIASVLLVLMALRRLPAQAPAEPLPRRVGDALLAAACGLGAAALVWSAAGAQVPGLADYFLTRSLPVGGGNNAVNVILVDFRGFDTLGEISVLLLAALVAGALLPRAVPATSAPRDFLLAGCARAVLPFAALVALFLFLRGHNLPGGGFAAGLTLALALVLRQMAQGRPAPAAAPLARLGAAGLALALAGGFASLFFGRPFLTSGHIHPVLPLLGELPLASAAVFDAGVAVLVVAAGLSLFAALERRA